VSSLKRINGFTLVELIVVIAMLGIVAAVAIPRFSNLQGAARASVVNGIAGTMRSAALMI